ncbi:hypothetical protein Tco_1017483 [Tanacetum coccineum]|uniref:Uncharacterized protein n=1 Tax=Tanacetum coccineum TaxID=301880 RepID=A0ABQ5FT11_9ASTR
MLTEPSRIAEYPSLDAKLAPTNSETKSDKELTPMNPEKDAFHRELTEINAGDQDEGQARPNPGEQDEGQARSNLGDAAESQPQSSHVVHAGPNLEHTDLESTDASTQQNPKQMDEEFTIIAYLNVQENLKLPTKDQEKPQEEEPEKTNTKSEVQSMIMVPIHQDTSLVPPMTTPVIDLSFPHSVSTTIHAPLLTSTVTSTTITKTTSFPSPPTPQPQQSTSDPIFYNALVSQAVDAIVTDVVDWAMQAPLRARFSDLPAVDMKEVL